MKTVKLDGGKYTIVYDKTDSYPAVRKILDDEIEKCITAGFIDLENLEAE